MDLKMVKSGEKWLSPGVHWGYARPLVSPVSWQAHIPPFLDQTPSSVSAERVARPAGTVSVSNFTPREAL